MLILCQQFCISCFTIVFCIILSNTFLISYKLLQNFLIGQNIERGEYIVVARLEKKSVYQCVSKMRAYIQIYTCMYIKDEQIFWVELTCLQLGSIQREFFNENIYAIEKRIFSFQFQINFQVKACQYKIMFDCTPNCVSCSIHFFNFVQKYYIYQLKNKITMREILRLHRIKKIKGVMCTFIEFFLFYSIRKSQQAFIYIMSKRYHYVFQFTIDTQVFRYYLQS
eukprot:TRINITY_DN673_c0_g1_i2.p3 TRINITY_DN673_c0_g1~~TRINITY_DN673_c0_g1_i2.p3  ORF type:complete len:224 (-),score=-13.41 TRINITY_DN673_c0_g1_i2:217-888(-)